MALATKTAESLSPSLLANSDAMPLVLEPGVICTGFQEGEKYRIKKPANGYSLFVDDEELSGDQDYWYWSPGFYAGRVRAELVTGEANVLGQYVLDVSPNRGKLGGAEFQLMLSELWQFDPALVLGSEPAQISVGIEGDTTNCWLQYARVRTYGESFIRALERISSRPISTLRAERRFVPLQAVRRADRQTAMTAMRCEQGAALFRDSPDHTCAPSPAALYDTPHTNPSFDCPANSCIVAIAISVTRRISQLQLELERLAENETSSGTRTSFAARWPRRRALLSDLSRALQKTKRSTLFGAVTRPEITAAGLNAVSADPQYAQVYRLGWQILRHGVNEPPSNESLWICPSWEVYERWCFIRLATLYQEDNPDFSWRKLKAKAGASAAVVGTKGDTRRIEILLQPRFPAGDRKTNTGFQSISGQREPDIVVVRTEPNETRWAVFDAKYRTTRTNVLDAMSSAHIYNDCLRLDGVKPEKVLLLVPRGGGAPWLESGDAIAQHGVGIVPLLFGSEYQGEKLNIDYHHRHLLI